MMFSLLPRLALAYNNVQILGNPSLGVGARLNNFRIVSVRNIMAKTKPLIETRGFGTSRVMHLSVGRLFHQYKSVPSLDVGCWPGHHSQRLNYHYLFSLPLSERNSYFPSHDDGSDLERVHRKMPIRGECSIIKDVSPDGVNAHMSLLEKIPNFAINISYDAESKLVLLDRIRCTIYKWYDNRYSSYQVEEKDWLAYIAESAFVAFDSIFRCLRYSVPSGVSLSSDINGHFLNGMMMDLAVGGGKLYLPYELTSSVDGRKMDLQVTANFIYVVYNKRPLEEMKNLDSVKADHWLENTPKFLKNLYHFLPTFDPNKHCAEVVFNPPYFWAHSDVLDFVSRLHIYIFKIIGPDIFDRLLTKMGYSWLDKLPERGTDIRALFDAFGGFSTYKKNIDVLMFWGDVREWDHNCVSGRMYEEGVVMEFEIHFELVWMLYRLCADYFFDYKNMTVYKSASKEYLLDSFGFRDKDSEPMEAYDILGNEIKC